MMNDETKEAKHEAKKHTDYAKNTTLKEQVQYLSCSLLPRTIMEQL